MNIEEYEMVHYTLSRQLNRKKGIVISEEDRVELLRIYTKQSDELDKLQGVLKEMGFIFK